MSMVWLEVTIFNKSCVNVILPALVNDENIKNNIKYIIFCNLLVTRSCVGYCSFETCGWLLHIADFGNQSKIIISVVNSYYSISKCAGKTVISLSSLTLSSEFGLHFRIPLNIINAIYRIAIFTCVYICSTTFLSY